MESTIPEGASHNPYKQFVESEATVPRKFDPVEYHSFGKYLWMEVTEETKINVQKQINNLQTTLFGTLRKFSNELNISQVQERVYLKLKIFEDEFNLCQIKARTPSEATICSNVLLQRLRVDMADHVRNILEEY